MAGLLHQVRQALLDHFPGDAGLCLVVGVSGGPDSLALLHLLTRLRAAFPLILHAVYVDHGLRPREAAAEAERVRQAGRDWQVKVRLMSVATRELAREEKRSPEEAARILRYRALREVAGQEGADRIVVGHTADDQAEGILLRLLRGGNRRGLAGMSVCRDDIFRPLLTVSRRDILAYLDRWGIDYCEDSSNADLRFTRNRVRHRLLPFLEEEFGPGVRSALRTAADNLGADEDFLDEQVNRAYRLLVQRRISDRGCEMLCLARPEFRSLHPCLRRRLVERILRELDCRPRHRPIMAVARAVCRGRPGSELHLGRGLRVGIGRDEAVFVYPRGKVSWRGRLAAG